MVVFVYISHQCLLTWVNICTDWKVSIRICITVLPLSLLTRTHGFRDFMISQLLPTAYVMKIIRLLLFLVFITLREFFPPSPNHFTNHDPAQSLSILPSNNFQILFYNIQPSPPRTTPWLFPFWFPIHFIKIPHENAFCSFSITLGVHV